MERFRFQKRNIAVAVIPRHFEEGIVETQISLRVSFFPPTDASGPPVQESSLEKLDLATRCTNRPSHTRIELYADLMKCLSSEGR